MTQIARPELSDEELKAKWSRPRAEIEADLARNPPAPNSALQAAQELPSVRICPDCQAHGVRTVQYGYRVRDEVCDRCEGDGYLTPPKPEADEVPNGETRPKEESTPAPQDRQEAAGAAGATVGAASRAAPRHQEGEQTLRGGTE